MKKATTGLVLLLVGLLGLSPGPAYAFRCGRRLVLVGDSTFDVRRKCGEPVSIDQRVIYRAVPEQSLDGSFLEPVFIPVMIKEWIYDFGPKRFIQQLSFEEGILRGIELLGYGN